MRTDVRLTSFSHGAGCACKLGPADLTTVLGALAPVARPDRLLVSADTGDDAAAWRLDDGRALIATVDVFTPIVDDPYDWGRVAATNALSDVYAMGGEPAFVLNVAGWPVDDLPLELLGRVLQGGQDVAVAAGAVVAGGHTITATEPIYGMVAVGFAEADRLLRNSTGRPGQRLFLTKPIGLGLITTAIKRGKASASQAEAAVRTMTTLNAAAASAAVAAGARTATDVTGFGLLGHLRTLLEASGLAARVDASAVPLLEGVLDLARAGVVAGGTRRNHAWLNPTTDWGELTEPEQLVLADAQTSGGLLIAVDEPGSLLDELRGRGVPVAEVGALTEGEPGRIRVSGRVGGNTQPR
jgi:selenide,water dikinase